MRQDSKKTRKARQWNGPKEAGDDLKITAYCVRGDAQVWSFQWLPEHVKTSEFWNLNPVTKMKSSGEGFNIRLGTAQERTRKLGTRN